MHRPHRIAALAAAILFMATPVRAIETDDITSAVTQVTIGAGVLRQNYKEFNDGLIPTLRPVLDFETGDIAAVQIGGGVLLRQFFVEGRLTIASGDTVYDGFLQYPGPVYVPYVGTTSNTIVSLQARFGYPFRPTHSVALIPYLEIGEHYWRRDVGYVEDYSHMLLGIGGKLLWNPFQNMVVDVGAGVGTTVLPLMTSDGYDYDLGSRPYRNGHVALDYRFVRRWHLRLSGEYRSWQYGQSPVVAGAIEPRSESVQVTYLLAAGYSFAR